jgi:hypothetical protein
VNSLDRSARNEAALRLAANWCIALVFIVACSSAYLRFSQAGLGCERWPECYGAIIAAGAPNVLGMNDAAGAGTAVEATQTAVRLTHRLAAMGVKGTPFPKSDRLLGQCLVEPRRYWFLRCGLPAWTLWWNVPGDPAKRPLNLLAMIEPHDAALGYLTLCRQVI